MQRSVNEFENPVTPNNLHTNVPRPFSSNQPRPHDVCSLLFAGSLAPTFLSGH